MGRVEQRLYRRRKKRVHLLRAAVLLVLLIGVAALLGNGGGHLLTAIRLETPTPTPVARAWDQTVQSREITLAQTSWYAIQTGVFSGEEAAQQKAEAYTDRGAPGMVVQDGDKWRVFIACYGSQEEAASVRQRLADNQGIETYLYTWTCPELRLRLSGMAGQLDVAESGLSLMLQVSERLRDNAILMDAGQLSKEEAAKLVEGMDDEVALWADTARSRFGKPWPDLIAALLSHTDQWGRSLAALTASMSATDMSAEMKQQGMMLYQMVINLRASIGTAE